MAAPTVGDSAPDFSLPAGDGSTFSLRDLRGKKVVLFFYPKDNTPGCTREACDFRDHLAPLRKKGAVVVGVSTDSPESHRKFAAKHDLSFTLVSDKAKEAVKKYGVWQQKSMFGKKYYGTSRTTFVIDEQGTITHVFPKVKVNGHVAEVLEVL